MNHTLNDFYNIDRTIKVSRLLPTDQEQCSEELETLFGNKSTALMCLDPGVHKDPCQVSTIKILLAANFDNCKYDMAREGERKVMEKEVREIIS